MICFSRELASYKIKKQIVLYNFILSPKFLRLWSSSRRGGGRSFFTNPVLLERAHEGSLVSRRLEATVTKLGRRVDELEADLFESCPLGVYTQRLKKNAFSQLCCFDF